LDWAFGLARFILKENSKSTLMAKVTFYDRQGETLPAVVFKGVNGTEAVAAAGIDGLVDLPLGDYTAKVVGFQDKPFRVYDNQNNPVTMRVYVDEAQNTLGEVQIVAERVKQAVVQNKWLILVGAALVIGGFIFYTRKK
jgi:LPXTG-motif cell wall-anchored protein